MNAPESELRTAAEQAKIWRCSARSVRQYIDRKDLPATLIGGRWLIAPEDAKEFERNQRNVRELPKRTRRPRRKAS